jgi:hypothetical protein
MEHLPTELMHTGERQLNLGLHAGDAGDATPGRSLYGVVEKGGLADSRLAAEHQHTAALLVDTGEQAVESVALPVAVAQSLPALRPCPRHG